ncbi:serine/threonine protein phosphatase [Paenibacillus swuensis]|uniref:Serine/threonine protein phosphatase n=1 Tax=Paenibacillus swuensis TaxID=1178515 RepID=A0A172TKH6_9BACL|nr:Stp1/IreP family PP2C-type Ser/Thr phosphatase [Paenibacillus swuensis]ANE47482.1 serine/threonine protein phosphatase [Paenibacillus swuensis]
MKSAYLTDIGRIRPVNEDRVQVESLQSGFYLAVVADGMGGHQAGETASQTAVEQIIASLQSVHKEMSIGQLEQSVKDAILKANHEIYTIASSQDQLRGMGTTVDVVLAADHFIIVGHIGDSRVYKLSEGNLRQLTEDHSFVNELVKSGQISSEEAIHHPRRNVVTRALGTEPHVEPVIQHLYWNEEDILLLCSDGLSNMVESEDLLRILAGENNLEGKARELVRLALEEGGDDNISAALLWNVPGDQEGKG